jgi:hypothetical protein
MWSLIWFALFSYFVMKIAKIVSSNSHFDYIARVIDAIDVAAPPTVDDYGFGDLVWIDTTETSGVVGAIYNSLLMNPDYASYGPRLSSKTELETFSPDFLNEQGALLGIVLIGSMETNTDVIKQGIPTRVVPVGQDVRLLDKDEIRRFHCLPDGISLNYYGHVMSGIGSFGIPLIERIIENLSVLAECTEEDQNKLAVLRRSLVWQRTVGQMRL